MTRDRTFQTLNPQSYEHYKEQGMLFENYFLNILWYKGLKLSEYQWIGYDLNEDSRTGKYRVALKDGKFVSIRNAQYLGEAFVRFPSGSFTFNEYNAGGFKKYVLAHYPTDSRGRRTEELVYFSPSGRLAGTIASVFKKYNITPDDIQEYIFRISRNVNNGFYNFELYFRDIDLPKIGEEFATRTAIKNRFTGNSSSLFDFDTKIGTDRFNWSNLRVLSVVKMIKDVLIPMERHKPGEPEYESWLTKYAGLSKEESKEIYRHRAEVRLP